MWWKQLKQNAENLRDINRGFDPTATIDHTARVVGEVVVGPGSKICPGAFIQGPVKIGANCLIGNNTMIRGPLTIGDGTIIGFTAEVKNAVIGAGVAIGPLCYVADSVLEDGVYLGAMVRTSNHRLDKKNVSVMYSGAPVDTGLEKLGAHIGAKTHLGIQCIILPGRMVPAESLFGPRITIEKNLRPGRYTLGQELNYTPPS